MNYENILVETRTDSTEGALRYGWITLNRPKALNALNDALMDELGHAVLAFDADESVACIVITGSEKAFAAGADIAMMHPFDFPNAYRKGLISRNWDTLRQVRKPVIAAVAGFALGGGCEVAMACDLIIAADTAKFGQPEIKLGIIPGAGGTQRLPRAVGKSKAMDLALTGRMMNAEEAERAGLVSRVVPAERLHAEAEQIARTLCGYSMLALMAVKESVNRAYEAPLTEGLLFERRLFHALFSSADQKEGMSAFLEKRAPAFTHC
jgi:enoyl-CoA hydratase